MPMPFKSEEVQHVDEKLLWQIKTITVAAVYLKPSSSHLVIEVCQFEYW